MLHYLVEGGIAGLRIAVQLHGATDDWDPFPEFLDELRAAGAEVVPIRVYRWHPAPRNGAFDQLVPASPTSKFDAVSFTSAPAVAAMLMRAAELGVEDAGARRAAHRRARDVRRPGDRPAAGAARGADVGAGADAAGRAGPSHHRRAAAAAVPHRRGWPATCWRSAAPACWSTARSRSCPPAAMATIRALALRPGAVVSRTDLLRALPGSGTDTHAVETAVLRLRTALGDKNIVSTVVKRGYRLRRRRAPGRRRMNPILVAHGTRKPGGVAMIGDLAARVGDGAGPAGAHRVRRRARPHPGRGAGAAPDRPAVLVPAFLASGYHVRVDIPAHVAASGHPDVTVTDALGPCPQHGAGARRPLVECGWRPGDSVDPGGGGHLRPAAQRDLRITAAMLSAPIGDRGRAGVRRDRRAPRRRRGRRAARPRRAAGGRRVIPVGRRALSGPAARSRAPTS